MPLRGGGSIRQTTATGSRVAAQLTRDRRRCPPQPPGDLAHPGLLGPQQRDLLALGERQVTSRRRSAAGPAGRRPHPRHQRRRPQRRRGVRPAKRARCRHGGGPVRAHAGGAGADLGAGDRGRGPGQPEDLVGSWTLVEDDWRLIGNKTGATRLGFAGTSLAMEG